MLCLIGNYTPHKNAFDVECIIFSFFNLRETVIWEGNKDTIF